MSYSILLPKNANGIYSEVFLWTYFNLYFVQGLIARFHHLIRHAKPAETTGDAVLGEEGRKQADKSEDLDEATKITEESIIPALKSQKGYRGAYILTDSKTGKAIGISLWCCEEAAIATEQSGFFEKHLGKLKDLLTAPPVREGYEVVVQE